MSVLGRLARAAGVSLLDLMRGSEKKRQFLEDHREIRFYNRVTLDLGVARDNEEFVIYGDIITLERSTGTLDIRFNEIEADYIELNRARKVITEFWRFYITNPAQAGLEATLLIGRDALFDVETVRAVGIIDTLGGDINPAQIAVTPTCYNVTMTLVDTEYSQVLPTGTKRFSAKIIEIDQPFRIAYVTGKVAVPTAPYYTVSANGEYYEDGLDTAAGLTLYFACLDAGNIVQIMAWV